MFKLRLWISCSLRLVVVAIMNPKTGSTQSGAKDIRSIFLPEKVRGS